MEGVNLIRKGRLLYDYQALNPALNKRLMISIPTLPGISVSRQAGMHAFSNGVNP